jgi:4-hydroxybenzoate polyprenyltransferase
VKLTEYVRAGDRATVGGYALYIALLTGGYYSNVTVVQLGLLDLGTRHVGLPRGRVSVWMAAIAVVALATAIGAALVTLGVDAVGVVPVVGSVLQGGVVLVGVGAVLITYFGLRRFEPVELPE